MFGSKSARIRELETRLDNALTRIGELGQDILTEQNVRRRAIDRAERAEDALQASRTETTASANEPRTSHVAGLEQRVADLQAANESLTAELASYRRADEAAPIGGAA